MSSCDSSLKEPLRPAFPAGEGQESEKTQAIIKSLNLQVHPEGGYFSETDRYQLRVPTPFESKVKEEGADSTRCASTTIYYMITPKTPQGHFHRNLGRTVHTLHSGRGRYILLHPEPSGKAQIETFVVGHDVAKGEKLQWVVEGGKYKASYLLPDEEGGSTSDGLLISETVVPGFEFSDHDFMSVKTMDEWATEDQAKELSWLLRKEEYID